jgi:hypothetical protein
VTIQWDLAEANRNLILLRQTANGFEKVEIRKDEVQNGAGQEGIKGNGHKQDDLKRDQVNGDRDKTDEARTNGVKHEEVRQDEPMPDQPHQNETKPDEPTPPFSTQDEIKPTEIKEDHLMPDRPKLWQPTTIQPHAEVKQDEPTPTSTNQDQLMPDHPSSNITPDHLVEEPEDISTPTPQPQPTLKISLSNPDLTSLTLSFPTPPSNPTSSVTTQTIPPSVPVETMSSLPRTYLPFLKPNQTYVLVFPGCSVPLLGQEEGNGVQEKEGGGEVQGKGQRKEVVIPGTWTTEFEVREREKAITTVAEDEELFVPTRLGRANTVPSFRMSFHE